MKTTNVSAELVKNVSATQLSEAYSTSTITSTDTNSLYHDKTVH